MRISKLLCAGLAVGFLAAVVMAAPIQKKKGVPTTDDGVTNFGPPGPGTALAPPTDACPAGDLGTLISAGGTIPFDTTGFANDFGAEDGGITDGSVCQPCCWSNGDSGPDAIGTFQVDANGKWNFSTCNLAPFDTSIMVLEDLGGGCPGDVVIGCNGDAGGCAGFTSDLTVDLCAGSTYYLLLDGWSSGTYGAVDMVFSRTADPCTADPECDDGLFCNGVETCDGCQCQPGTPVVCVAPTPFCSDADGACIACSAAPDPDAACGDDGIACNGLEQCDLGSGDCIVVDACDLSLGLFCTEGTCSGNGAPCNVTSSSSNPHQQCYFCSGGANDGLGCATDFDCTDGFCDKTQTCDNGGPNTYECLVPDPCLVYSQDDVEIQGTSFAPFALSGCHANARMADEISIRPGGGRELVSYRVEMLARNLTGFGIPCDTPTYSLHTSLYTAPLGSFEPGVEIAGTACDFPQPVDPGGTPAHNLVCAPGSGVVLPPGDTDADVDVYLVLLATGDCAGGAGPPLPVGPRRIGEGRGFQLINPPLGALAFENCDGGTGLPDGTWGLGAFGGPTRSDFQAELCTVPVGPCCFADFTCALVSADDCAAGGGTYNGDSTIANPLDCSDTLDTDGVADLCDNCPDVNNANQLDCNDDGEGDACEPADEQDNDFDGVCNGVDGCPEDPAKSDPGTGLGQAPGQCGCGNPDDDTDGDGTADCIDGCPLDPNKVAPGVCGCGVPDVGDEDGDGFLDCVDQCRGVDDAVFAPECEGAIPTVSEWGLLILALLLLVAGKVYFGRRTATA